MQFPTAVVHYSQLIYLFIKMDYKFIYTISVILVIVSHVSTYVPTYLPNIVLLRTTHDEKVVP